MHSCRSMRSIHAGMRESSGRPEMIGGDGIIGVLADKMRKDIVPASREDQRMER